MDVIGRTAPVMDVTGRTAPVMDVIGRMASTGGCPLQPKSWVTQVCGPFSNSDKATTRNLRIEQTPIHAVLPQDRGA
jgi:hypothetical protein